jgi:hypothetical protein
MKASKVGRTVTLSVKAAVLLLAIVCLPACANCYSGTVDVANSEAPVRAQPVVTTQGGF